MSDTKNSNLLGWAAMITAVTGLLALLLARLDKPAPNGPPVVVPDSGRVEIPKPSPRPMPPQPQPTTQPAAPNLISSTASGHVMDENGQPVAGAKVRCTDCLPPSPAAVTDSDGQFSLPFRVERTHEIQDIHLSVSGHKNSYPIRVSDPTGRVLRPN